MERETGYAFQKRNLSAIIHNFIVYRLFRCNIDVFSRIQGIGCTWLHVVI